MKRVALCLMLVSLFVAVWPAQAQQSATTYKQRLVATAPANLVAYWPLDELTGTTAYDWSGANRHGVITGATLNALPGPDGVTGSMSFDGINDVVNVYSASLASAFNPNAGTISLWAKAAASSVWTDTLLRRLVVFESTSGLNLLMQKNNNGSLGFVRIGTATKQLFYTTTSTAWVHYVWTWSTATDALIAYVNGVEVARTNAIGTASALNSVALIGAGQVNGTWCWNGFLSHVAVWNVPLTAAQVAGLALAVVPPSAPNYTDEVTLASGQVAAVEYRVDAGQVMLIVLGLLQLGLLAVVAFFGLVRRV